MALRSANVNEQALREAFKNLCDEDGNITSDQLREAVEELGLDFTDDEIEEMIEVADVSGTGSISYTNLVGMVKESDEEFPKFISGPSKDEARATSSTSTAQEPSSCDENALRKVFKRLSSENGNITSAKLRHVVKNLDLDFTDDEIQDMIAVADNVGDGEVSYRGMVGMIKESNTVFPRYASVASKEALRRELTVLALETEDSVLTINKEQTSLTNDDRNGNGNKTATSADDDNFAATRIPVVIPMDTLSVADDNDDDENEHSDSELERVDKHETLSTVNVEEVNRQTTAGSKKSRAASSRTSYIAEHSLDDQLVTAVGEYEVGNKNNNDVGTTNDERPDTNGKRVTREVTERSIDGEHEHIPSQSTASNTVGREEDSQPIADDRRSNVLKSVNAKIMKSEMKKKPASLKSNSTQRETTYRPTGQKRNFGVPKHIPRTRKTSTGASKTGTGYHNGIGCALKLSQLRMKQRLLYIMWRTLYDEAVQKIQ